MSVAIVDSFKKIKLLPDGTEVLADKTSDTLTLKAGLGVTFLVLADGTAGTSPGQGPVIEINNTGLGNAVLDDVLKFGNISNQAMTVGSATIDSLLIDNSQITQTDSTKDLVWRTQTTSYTLVPPGTPPPTPTGVGPFSVTFPIASQIAAPATSVWYFVANNANPLYNGVYKATASTTSSLTLEYPTNPGVYGIQATSLSSNGSVVQINFAALPNNETPFTPYVDNAGDYVTVSGFTSTGSAYNGTYPVKTAGLTYVTFDSGINVVISSGYGVVTKPTSAATAVGTNNTISLTNNLIIASTQGLKLPIGSTAQRPAGPLPLSGFIRYNTDLGAFEGYVGTAGWASLGGVRSVDGYTYITAESTSGASDDTLRLYTSTNAPGSYLSLTVDKDNTKILTKGLVLPTGNNTTDRPGSPLAGMIRFNNTDNVFEGYANSAWSSLGGVRSVDGQTLIRAETSASSSNDRLDFITSLNTSVTSTTDIGDYITVNATTNLYVGQPIEFVGTVVGGVTAGVTYYVKTIVGLNVTVSTDPALATIVDITADTSGNPMFIVTKAFTADKDNVTFGSKGLIIPTGNTAGRPATPLTGQVRFNTGTTQFEGYIGTAWSSLGGVRSVDGLTYITPETSPGYSDDTLHFYAATGVSTTAEAAQISSAGATLLDNRYVALRESATNGTREIKLKAPAAIDITGDTYTLTLPTKLGAAGTLLALNNATGTLEFVNADSFGGSRINVSATGGDDLNDGINKPVKTIKRGLQLASALVYTQVGSTYVPNGKKIVVSVANGDYYEDNPLIVADNVSVLGAGLRSTILRPLNANKDLLRVRNGTYFGEFTFRDHLTGGGITGVPDFTWGYSVAFDNPKDATTSRVGYTLPTTKPTITISPYIQAVSLISFLGGNGAYVDGSLVNTPNVTTNQIEVENPVSGPAPEQGKSMVANAFTMLSFGGTGWRVTNDAYAQIVSCFQIFMLHGSYCLSGGYLSITNSATNFGTYALRSTGYSTNAFQFDKGYVVSTGLLTGGIQTITAIGFGRAPTVHYVTRFRTPDYKIAYDLIKSDKTVIQDAVITSAGTAGYAFTYFKTTVTNNTGGTWTCASTANFTVGEKVEFTGTVFGGVGVGNTYYIKTIAATTFTLSTSPDISSLFTGSNGTGTMTMKLKHDTVKSNRDIGLVLDAVVFDLYTGGNQQSVLAGQSFYTNGILTSVVSVGTQCIAMINVARGLARAYVAPVITTNPTLLGGYGLVVSWTGGTGGTLPGPTLTPLSATFTSTISGNVLTITSAVGGTGIAVGMALSGGSVTAGTYIVGTNGVGTGNGSTWIINQAATGTPTAAGNTGFTNGDVVTVWAGNSNATATATVVGGVVTVLTLANPGTGYAATGTKVTASVATSIVGKFDIVTSILADVTVAPTAIAYGNASDVSSNYIPSGTTYSFNAATAVNISSNTITLTGTGLGLSGKRLVYSTNGNSQIPGLDGGQPYYPGGISEGGGNTTFALYYDDLLKLQVDIAAVGSGTHQILTDQKDFFINSIVSSHNSYQNIKPSGSPSVTAFAPGQLLTGGTSGAQGYVYSWDMINNNLVVSLNDVLISASVVKQPFASGELINSTYTISSVSTLTGYYTGTFAVAYSDSTILALNNTAAGGYPSGMYNSNPLLVSGGGGSGAVSTEIWLHRPSIVNSSGHTWEYAGSGTDYNALPQNGGQSDFTKEQWSDSPGRVYSSGTNELGDFKVGKFITAENRTGNVTFTNTVTVASLNVLKLALGNISISELSNDTGLGDNESGGAKDSRLSTQLAIKSYLKNHLGNFIDRNLSTNAVPNAVPQLNSQGQLNVDLIPPIRTFNTYIAEGYGSRVNLVEEITDSANNILNGDIATEKYSTQSLTLGTGTIYTTPITALKGATVTQSTSLASGYLSSDVTSSTIVTVASAAKTFSYFSSGLIVPAPFNTSYPITIAGNAYPSDVITVVAGVAGTNNLVNGRSYKIGTPGSVNWASIGSANALSGTTFTYNNVTVSGSGGTFYSQVYLTTTTATMASSSIAGTTLTVGTVTGTILIGMILTGGTIPASTYIVSQISAGAGAGSTWTVNQSVGANTGSITITGTVSNTPATGIENNYVLNNAAISEYLILDPAVTYAFNGLTVSSVAPLVTGTQYVITTVGSVNWNSIGYVGTPTVGGTFAYNGVTITGSGGADIASVVSANESYTANTAGVLGGSLYRTGVFTSFTTYTGGSGYNTSTATIYYSVALTNISGTGSGATADITVQNNAVVNIDIRRGGIGYAVGNTLSAADASLGGRTGGAAFTLTVSAIEKRLYITFVNSGKISAGSAVAQNNFIQDNNAVVKSVVLGNTVTLNFNSAATPTGNVNVTNNSIDIAHSFSDGDPIRLITIAFGGLTTNTFTYYVRVLSASSFRLYTNYSLNSLYLVTISGSGSGTGTFVRYNVDIYANTIYLPAHGYSAGDAVKLTNVSGMPTVGGVAIPDVKFYYVGGVVTGINVPSFTSNCFTLHTSRQTALTMFNGASPLGIVDIDGVGSGTMSVTKQNVTITGVVNTSSTSTANWSNLTSSNIDASNIISGVVATTRLGSGIANSNTFLRGDSSWQYAVQGIKETLTPLSLSGSSYANANNASFTGQIRGVRYVNSGAVTSVSAPWTVTYSFTSTASPAPTASYWVEGASVTAFNGQYTASGSTDTSLTLTYASNPGNGAGAAGAIIYLATGNILYVSGVSSGTITPGMTLNTGTSPYIVAGTSGNGSTGASTWTVSQNLSVPLATAGSIAIQGTSTDNVFYGNVGIDIDKVDGNSTLSAAVADYTNFGVASFNTTQFYVGRNSTSDLGQVYVKDLVINAGKLNGQSASYYTDPTNLSSAVQTNKGGTGFSAYAVGDMLYASSITAPHLSKLNIGTNNQILTSSGTVPQWSDNLSVPGNITVAGNLTVNGITTTVNSSTITVDDKNIELGVVASVTGLGATLSLSTAVVTLTAGTTKGLIPGMALTKTDAGLGTFGTTPRIFSVNSLTQITLNVNHAAAGAIVFDAGGITDFTANDGGITLKGATDKTIIYDNTNNNWTASEHWNIATGKVFKINNTTVLSSTQILGLTPGGSTTGDLVTINATQTLTNKTLQDSTTTFQDDANTLKKHQLNASAIGGSGATFTVTTSAGGAVTAVNATPAATGSGYAVNDIITLESPGAPTTKVTITINTITAGGAIATFTTSTLPGTSAGYTVSQTNVVGTSAIGSAITTRIHTLPPASTTLVGTDSYQTLTNKTLTAPILNDVATLSLRDTAAAFDLTIASTSNTVLTADRTLTLDVNNAARTIDIAGNLTIANNFTTSGNFALTLTQTAATNVTLPTTGTLSTLAGAESLTNKTLAAATTTLKDTANRSVVFTLSAGTGLQIGNITVTLGSVENTGVSTVTAGFGYAVNDRVYLNGNPTGSGAVFQVSTVTATGAVTGLSWVAGGSGYTNGTLQTFSTTASTVDTETALRTYNLPSSDGSDVLVTQDATQTLTNKTLTTPTIGTSMIVPIIYGSSLSSGQLKLSSTTNGTKPTAGVVLEDNIASSSTLTGSLVVTGGVGLSLDLWSGGSGYFATSVRSPTYTTNGATNLVLSTNAGTNSGTITINQGVSGNINITPNGTGVTNLGDTTASGIITTGAAAATLTLSTNNGTNSGTIVVNAGANTDIVALANGTGNVKLNTLNINNAGTVTSGTWQGSLVAGTYGGTGVNNGTKTITLGDNFTTSGAAALTLTLNSAAATNATFPATGNITLAYTGHKLSAFAATTSAELAGVISDETGSGVLVFSTSPSFTTDIRTPKVTTATAVNLVLETNLGTTTGNITIVTGLNGNINITPNGTGSVNLGTVTSSGLLTTGAAAANLVLSTNNGTNSGTITINQGINGNIAVTPNGTGTVLIPTVNNLTITNSTGTLTIAAAKILTVSNTLTFTGTDSSSVAFGAGGTVAYTSNKLSVFAATTSAELAGVISDETGSGKLTFATSPTFTTDITTPVIYGSAVGAGTLTLRSTSDTTKGQVVIDESTAASSTTTGALKVGGGVGIAGKLYTGGDISAGTNDVYAGRFRAGDGSAVNPSFAFNSDGAVDTGFYWGGDGYINWTNNGVFKGQFRPDGTAQIGTVLTTSITTGADATAGTIQGTWTLSGTSKLQATYADLAEYYEADQEYEVGTVLVFGGDKEITTTNLYADRRVAGVVSATAAYLMNQDCPGIKLSIALQGRVPVSVVGAVKKGDLLVTSEFPGYAVVNNDPKPGTVIGKAIANKDDAGKGTVEVSVGRT